MHGKNDFIIEEFLILTQKSYGSCIMQELFIINFLVYFLTYRFPSLCDFLLLGGHTIHEIVVFNDTLRTFPLRIFYFSDGDSRVRHTTTPSPTPRETPEVVSLPFPLNFLLILRVSCRPIRFEFETSEFVEVGLPLVVLEVQILLQGQPQQITSLLLSPLSPGNLRKFFFFSPCNNLNVKDVFVRRWSYRLSKVNPVTTLSPCLSSDNTRHRHPYRSFYTYTLSESSTLVPRLSGNHVRFHQYYREFLDRTHPP